MADRNANEDPLITHAENASTKKREISVKRLLTAAAILGLVALMLPATAGIVLGDGTATVTFHKAITSDPTGPNAAGDFLITLTGGTTYSGYDGQTVTVDPGTYTLTEAQLANYVSASGGGCYGTNAAGAPISSGSTVPIAAGDTWNCGFDNQYVPPPPPYCVTVFKQAAPGGVDAAYLPGAVFVLKDANGVQVGDPVTSDANGQAVLCGVVDGDSVWEITPPPGYLLGGGVPNVDQVPSDCFTTAVTAPSAAVQPKYNCFFVDPKAPTTYCISVAKTNTAGAPLVATFAITEPSNGNFVTVTFSTPHDAICGLLAGTYVVTETVPPTGYTGGDPQSVTLPAATPNGSASLTFLDAPIVVPPTPTVGTSCGGTATFSNALAGWTLTVDSVLVGTFGSTGSIGPLAEGVGSHTYSILNAAGAPVASGTFAIGACYVPPPVVNPTPSPSPSPSPTPSPSPSPSASPSPVATPTPTPNSGNVGGAGATPPPTSTIRAASTGSDSPLVPLSIALLLIAATGLVFVRRPKSR
jgi:hypothetical protein